MENINEALILMVVGMGTVFLILLFIIYFSKWMIALINKYVPEDVQQVAKNSNAPSTIPSNIIAAITSAVNIATQGKAQVTKIEKE